MKEPLPRIRIPSMLVACVLALSLCVGLTGCDLGRPSDEELIRAAVTQVLDSLKDPTEESLSRYVAADDIATLAEHGIDPYEYLGHALARFDYTIDDVTVDGDTARADLTVTNVDLGAAMEAATAWLEDNPDEYEDTLGDDDALDQVIQLLLDRLYEEIDRSDDLVSSSVTITFTKVDDVWQVDEDSMDGIVSALYGGLEL